MSSSHDPCVCLTVHGNAGLHLRDGHVAGSLGELTSASDVDEDSVNELYDDGMVGKVVRSMNKEGIAYSELSI